MAPHADLTALLLAEARKLPRLDQDKERELVTRYRNGDHAALGHLIIGNVRLSTSRASALRGYGLQADDLIQEGVVGLLEAATRFDVNRDIPFGGYAAWWVQAITIEFVLRNWSIVRAPSSGKQKALFFNLRKLRAKLARDPSVDPSSIRNAIAAAAGVPVRDVGLMEARLSGDISLNAPAPWDENGEAEIGDGFADDGPLPDDLAFAGIDFDEREIALRTALAALDDQERLVVQERWLTNDIAPLKSLGEFLGISASRVKRIEIGAIMKMQGLIANSMQGLAA